MRKPHVLFVTEKWCDCNPERGLTNSFHNLFGSLECSGLATYENLFFDEYTIEKKIKVDKDFIEKGIQADLVVVTPLNGIHHAPGIRSYKHIKKPIVAIHFDSVSPKNLAYADLLIPYITCNVVLDSGKSYLNSLYDEKYLPLWTPQDPRIFYNPNKGRDINLSFLGTMIGRKDREDGINFLGARELPVYQMGGQREKFLTIEEYADVLQRSVITLNFSFNSQWHQLKGRIFEALLCGACLVESKNDEITKYFSEGEHFYGFRHTEELRDVIRGLIFDRKAVDKVAKQGQERCETLFNGTKWWEAVFERVRCSYPDFYVEAGKPDFQHQGHFQPRIECADNNSIIRQS